MHRPCQRAEKWYHLGSTLRKVPFIYQSLEQSVKVQLQEQNIEGQEEKKHQKGNNKQFRNCTGTKDSSPVFVGILNKKEKV